MYQTAKLCQWPQRPSSIWELSRHRFSSIQCRDFDFAVVDFWDWYQERQHEQIEVREPKHRKGYVQAPKYTRVQDILDLYYRERGTVSLDPIVASMTDEALASLIDTWDPSAPIEHGMDDD